MPQTHNCLYYWAGGSERGEWRRAMPITSGPCASARGERTLSGMAKGIERQGYTVVWGHTDIGPPDGPPRR